VFLGVGGGKKKIKPCATGGIAPRNPKQKLEEEKKEEVKWGGPRLVDILVERSGAAQSSRAGRWGGAHLYP